DAATNTFLENNVTYSEAAGPTEQLGITITEDEIAGVLQVIDDEGALQSATKIFSTPQTDGIGCAEVSLVNAQQTDTGMDVLVEVTLNDLFDPDTVSEDTDALDTDSLDSDSLDTDNPLPCTFAFAEDAAGEHIDPSLGWNSAFYILRLAADGAVVSSQLLVTATDATAVYSDFQNGGATTLAMNAIAMEWGQVDPVEIHKDERTPGTHTGAIGRFDTSLNLINAVETSPLNSISRLASGELLLDIQNSFLLFGSLSGSSSLVAWMNQHGKHIDRGVIQMGERYFVLGKNSDVFGVIAEDLTPKWFFGGYSNTLPVRLQDTLFEVVDVGPELESVNIGSGQTALQLNGSPHKFVYYLVSQGIQSEAAPTAVAALAIGPKETDPGCIWQNSVANFIERECVASAFGSDITPHQAASKFLSSPFWGPVAALATQKALSWMDGDCLVPCAPEDTCALTASCTTSTGAIMEFSWGYSREDNENCDDECTEEYTQHEIHLSMIPREGTEDWNLITVDDTYSSSLVDNSIEYFMWDKVEDYSSKIEVTWRGVIDEQLPVDGFVEFLDDDHFVDKENLGQYSDGFDLSIHFPECWVDWIYVANNEASSYGLTGMVEYDYVSFNGTRYGDSDGWADDYWEEYLFQ
ncbi:MAG: hypothetical protein JXX14_20530, partial [Deltaproteobacteria bacterium]|nr:hypothetical protein [Deltaproteobacteria bacterium]